MKKATSLRSHILIGMLTAAAPVIAVGAQASTSPVYSTYTAPFGGYSSATSIWTDAKAPCGDLSFKAASGYTFPKGIATGTSVTLTGVRGPNGYSGVCYDMTKVKKLVVNSSPSPSPTPTPSPSASPSATPTHTATPNPTPSSTASGSCATLGSISKLPYCAYAANSTWNQPLPESPAINPNSAAMLGTTFANFEGKFYVNPPGSFPHYFTHSGDPTVKIDLTLNYGSSNLQGATVPMPADAVPAPPSDAHLTVLDAASGNEYDYYQFPQNKTISSGETIDVGFGNIVNYITGSGWGGTTTAAGAALLSGLVTVDEFMSGSIHHALAMAPGCNNGAGSVYPATASASAGCPDSSGAGIPHGSRIWSDLTDSQVDALGMDNLSSMLLKALHQYGGFVTDTNGWRALDIRNLLETPTSTQGQSWWNANGGNNPALNNQPASFFTTHLHVLQVCVTQGSC